MVGSIIFARAGCSLVWMVMTSSRGILHVVAWLAGYVFISFLCFINIAVEKFCIRAGTGLDPKAGCCEYVNDCSGLTKSEFFDP
jgi:hypothetical protein